MINETTTNDETLLHEDADIRDTKINQLCENLKLIADIVENTDHDKEKDNQAKLPDCMNQLVNDLYWLVHPSERDTQLKESERFSLSYPGNEIRDNLKTLLTIAQTFDYYPQKLEGISLSHIDELWRHVFKKEISFLREDFPNALKKLNKNAPKKPNKNNCSFDLNVKCLLDIPFYNKISSDLHFIYHNRASFFNLDLTKQYSRILLAMHLTEIGEILNSAHSDLIAFIDSHTQHDFSKKVKNLRDLISHNGAINIILNTADMSLIYKNNSYNLEDIYQLCKTLLSKEIKIESIPTNDIDNCTIEKIYSIFNQRKLTHSHSEKDTLSIPLDLKYKINICKNGDPKIGDIIEVIKNLGDILNILNRLQDEESDSIKQQLLYALKFFLMVYGNIVKNFNDKDIEEIKNELNLNEEKYEKLKKHTKEVRLVRNNLSHMCKPPEKLPAYLKQTSSPGETFSETSIRAHISNFLFGTVNDIKEFGDEIEEQIKKLQ